MTKLKDMQREVKQKDQEIRDLKTQLRGASQSVDRDTTGGISQRTNNVTNTPAHRGSAKHPRAVNLSALNGRKSAARGNSSLNSNRQDLISSHK